MKESIIVTIALARKSRNPEQISNAGAVAMLNHAAQAILDASHMLGGIDDCPHHVIEAYSAVTNSLSQLP